MALKKAFTNEKGITTEYHMIAGLKVTDRIEVVLKSYIDESYRLQEKVIEDNICKVEELQQQALEASVQEEIDFELIESINEEIASIDTVLKDYSAYLTKYKLPFNKEVDDISYATIYEKLKSEAKFASAEDC